MRVFSRLAPAARPGPDRRVKPVLKDSSHARRAPPISVLKDSSPARRGPVATLRPFALAVLLAACTTRPLGSSDSATGSSSSTTTTTAADVTSSTSPPVTTAPPVTTTSPTTTTGDPATTALDTGVESTAASTTHGDVSRPDQGTSTKECDPWIEDCPEGQKCMPVSLDGDNSWESLLCVDIVPNPAGVGEPCTAGPIDTGEDTCAKHSMCWKLDPDTRMGTCVAFCTGSPDNPSCDDPGSYCSLNSDGVLIVCLPQCDPIIQDCPNDDLCIPNPMNPGSFICVLDASGDEGQNYDPCDYANACDKGLFCVGPELSNQCDPMAPGCCIAFCDLSAPVACTTPGEECLPWFEPGKAPPGFENVGACGLPQ